MISPSHKLSTCILPSAPAPLSEHHSNVGQSRRKRRSAKRRQRLGMTAIGAVRAAIGLEPAAVNRTAADICGSGRAVPRAGENLLRPLTPATSPQECVCCAVLVCDGVHSHASHLTHKRGNVQCQTCDARHALTDSASCMANFTLLVGVQIYTALIASGDTTIEDAHRLATTFRAPRRDFNPRRRQLSELAQLECTLILALRVKHKKLKPRAQERGFY